jgi:alkanesulfonate monooxygenase SsuD/methylene tetrahydromethanopterin reductase-like flavin-dependent oxidoreductase (luciferase family)
MQLDIHVPRFTWPGGPEAIGPTFATLAQTAESIGVRTLSVMDHWFQMEMLWPAEEPMLEGYTALSFAAAKTERLRFRLLVGGVTYRHPGLLAKTITTLDVLSGGRAELGLGAAWYEREHLGLGVPFPPLSERYERLEETLQICFQMWSDDNGPYEGVHYRLAETLCRRNPSARHDRGSSSGAVGNERRCGLWLPTPMLATSSAMSKRSGTRSACSGATAMRSDAILRRSR